MNLPKTCSIREHSDLTAENERLREERDQAVQALRSLRDTVDTLIRTRTALSQEEK